jgi:choloylglycine hydrolase
MKTKGSAGALALLGIPVLAGGVLVWPSAVDACTRLLWNDNKLAVMAGRSMDWPESTQPVLTVLPRAMKRDGGLAGGEVVVKENRPAGPRSTAAS